MSLIEKWCRSLDSGGHAGALLIGVSKAFNCIDRDLLIAKLKAYGLGTASLNLFISCWKETEDKSKFVT